MQILRSLLVLGLFLAACGGDKPQPPKEDEHDHDHASHEAPHGGEILDLGGGAAHLEVIHDGDGGNITIYVFGGDLKTPVAVEAPAVNLVTAAGPVMVPMTATAPAADGKSAEWNGSHEALKADPLDGRIRVKIADKTYQSPIEPEGHDHK